MRSLCRLPAPARPDMTGARGAPAPRVANRENWVTDEAAQRKAFEALYAAHADAVFRYARRRTGRDIDADDVVAEAFAVAWRRLRDVPAGRELPWLYGVARRVRANQRRSHERRDRLRARLEAEPPVSADSSAAEEGVAREVLDTLSPRDREILLLSVWEQLAAGDIAVALGISENAVYVRLHRARQRFAAAYEEARSRPAEDEGGDRQ